MQELTHVDESVNPEKKKEGPKDIAPEQAFR
jgi:hypothetical protein